MSADQFPEKLRGRALKPRLEGVLPGDWEDFGPERAEEYMKWMKDTLGKRGFALDSSKAVLEIGSRAGHWLELFKKEGISAVGVDSSPRSGGGGPQAAARVERLPFPNNTFDLVVSARVFDSRIYNQAHALMMREIARVTRPNGYYFGFGEEIEASSSGLRLLSDKEETQLGRFLYMKES